MSRSPRAEALSLMQSGATIAPPEMPDLGPDSPEAFTYLDELKSKRFVVLAQVMDTLLEQALEQRGPDKRSLVVRRGYHKDKWQSLADNWRDELQNAQKAIESTEIYETADKFALVKGRLHIGTHTSVDTQLWGGIGTGISNTLTLLRNVPHIVSYHAKSGETIEPATIARHPRSIELIRRLTKLSINQSMAAQTALSGEDQPSTWAELDKVLEPERFRLHRYENETVSIGYADFTKLKVPAGYRPHSPLPAVTQATPVQDIISQQTNIIGCPITLLTLLQQRLGQMWHWGVDLVDANGLWEENWPPAVGEASN